MFHKYLQFGSLQTWNRNTVLLTPLEVTKSDFPIGFSEIDQVAKKI